MRRPKTTKKPVRALTDVGNGWVTASVASGLGVAVATATVADGWPSRLYKLMMAIWKNTKGREWENEERTKPQERKRRGE
jgi:hypothetical protein